MSDPAPEARRERRPVVGPYGRCWYDDDQRRWRVALTADGQRRLEAYLVEYPEPIKFFVSRCRAQFSRILRLGGEIDDVDGAIRVALVQAMIRWTPDRKGRAGTPETEAIRFTTVVGWALRAAASDMVRYLSRGCRLRPLRADRDGVTIDEIPARESAAERDVSDVSPHDLLAGLSERERTVLELSFGFSGPPLNLGAVGRRLNPPVVRERVRQIRAAALARVCLAADSGFRQLRARVTDVLLRGPAHSRALCAGASEAAKAQIRVILGVMHEEGTIAAAGRSGRLTIWCLTEKGRAEICRDQ